MGKKKVTKPCKQANLSSAQVYSDLSFWPKLCLSMGGDTCDKEKQVRAFQKCEKWYFVSKIILTYFEKKSMYVPNKKGCLCYL
jgi:hypothetical protein